MDFHAPLENSHDLMSFKDDKGGFAFSCSDGKICINASTWSTRLSQIGKMTGEILIVTNQLPNVDYIVRILSKRPRGIRLICNSNAKAQALDLKSRLPSICVATHERSNAKLALIAPDTVWQSSADFGEVKQINSTVGLHSSIVHDRIVDEVFEPLWEEADEL